ncbi:hypothetical protein BLA29_003136, partial [Euroglyphus maynei]
MLPNYSTDDVCPSSLNSDSNHFDMMNIAESFSIIDFYKNKTIFITGATGFIGKVLLQQILSKCCSVRKIYLLIRSKRSESCHERLAKMLSTSILFKNLQDKFHLIKAIDGDITAKDLSLSEEDRNRLIEEKIYPVVTDKDVEVYLKQLTEKYADYDLPEGHSALQNRPNPYTLSKAIAEWLVKEKYQSTLPIIVCRPSIVISSYKEPFPGWCDSISGVSGSFILFGLGIGQKFIVDKTKTTDLIPVDLVVNSLIVCGAYRASSHYSPDKNVVHITTSNLNPVSWDRLFNLCIDFERRIPSLKQVRPISIDYSNNYTTVFDKFRYKFHQIINHLLFAAIFDLIFMVMGHKPLMVKIIQRFHKLMFEMKFFSLRQWNFVNNNLPYIYKLVDEKERPLFNCDVTTIDWEDFAASMCHGLRKYLLKDPDSTYEQARLRRHRIHVGFRLFAIFKYFLFYFICKKYLLETILDVTFFYSIPFTIIDLAIYSYLIR